MESAVPSHEPADRGPAPPADTGALDLLIDETSLAHAIVGTAQDDAVWLPLLGPRARRSLLSSVRTLAYRPSTPIVGEGKRAVQQRFELCMDIPDRHPVRDLAAAMNAVLDEALRARPTLWTGPTLHFNDLIVQRYEPGRVGITPHRDHIRYVGLVAVVVLSGQGRFCMCTDRLGADAREIPCPPGGAILMRAPGLAGTVGRPFHFVEDIARRRYTIGLRHDARAVAS